MTVQRLIAIYILICTAIIIYSIFTIPYFRGINRPDSFYKRRFYSRLMSEFHKDHISITYKYFLMLKLVRLKYVSAFDEFLKIQCKEDRDATEKYMRNISSLLVSVTLSAIQKNPVLAAFFPYLIYKNGFYRENTPGNVIHMLRRLLSEKDYYIRENAVTAVFSFRKPALVEQAALILNESDSFIPANFLQDLRDFKGNKEEMYNRLLSVHSSFMPAMQKTIIDSVRESDIDYRKEIFDIFRIPGINEAVAASCLQYFEAHKYEKALLVIVSYASSLDTKHIELASAASATLGMYPCRLTTQILFNNLSNKNGYIAYNSVVSLLKQGFTYIDFTKYIDGPDKGLSNMILQCLSAEDNNYKRGN